MRKRVLLPLMMVLVLSLAVPSRAARNERIVTLWGDITEIMFGLGYGDRIVAVDATSNYPSDVERLPKLRFPGNFLGSAEAILAYEPTKVIAAPNVGPAEVLDQLRAVGVEVIIVETGADTLDSPTDNIRAMAALLGAEEQGERFVAEVEGKINEAVTRGQQLANKPRVLFILFSSLRMQFIGGLGSEADVKITAAGAINAASEIGLVGMEPYTVEGVVAAAPDVIIVTDRGLSNVGGIEGVLEWPGIALTPAGEAGNIISFEDLYFMGLGPRTGDSLLELVEAFELLQ